MYTGTLIVRPTTAKLTYDTEWFARMDPYCKVTIGGTVQQTSVAVNQSKTPNWQDTLSFRVNGDQSMHVMIFDKDYVTRDDYIGELTVPLNEVYQKGRHTGWYNVMRKGRSAGQIMIVFEFTPDGGMMGGMGMGGMNMGMSNMGMGNMGMGMGNMGMSRMGMGGMGMSRMGMGGMGMGGMGMNQMGMGGMNMGMGMPNPAMGYGGMNTGMGMGMGSMGMGMGINNPGMGMGGYNNNMYGNAGVNYNNPNLPPGFFGGY